MAARKPSETPAGSSASTLGARLRASDAFADVRDYVRTGLTSPEGSGTTLASYRDPEREPRRDDPTLDTSQPDTAVSRGAGRRRILVVSLLVATGIAGLATAAVVIAAAWSPSSPDGSTGVDPSPASSTTHATGQDGAATSASVSPTSSAADPTPSRSVTPSGTLPGIPRPPGSSPTSPSDPTSSPASSPSSKPTSKPTRPTPTKSKPTKPAAAQNPRAPGHPGRGDPAFA